MTDFLKIAKSIVVHFAHICAYGVETVNKGHPLPGAFSSDRLEYKRSNFEQVLRSSSTYCYLLF